MRFSVLLAALAALSVPCPVLADTYADLDRCKFVGEIAKASDVSPATFYRYFSDVESVALQLAWSLADDLQAAFLRIVEARVQVQSARAQGLRPTISGCNPASGSTCSSSVAIGFLLRWPAYDSQSWSMRMYHCGFHS